MDLNSQNLCQKPGWQQAWEVETGRCQGHSATQPNWVIESRGTVMRLLLKSQGGRYLQNSTWGWPLAFTCPCARDDKDWPLPLLPWRDRDSTFIPYQDQSAQVGRGGWGILWLWGSSFKVTIVKNNTANSRSIRSHMGHRGHPWLWLQFLQKETSVCCAVQSSAKL